MNDIEKQLAQNANNKTFEYKEAYWDSALATLKAAEAVKRRKGFFWIFFALFLVVGIGVYFAINLTNNSEVATYIKRNNNLNTDNAIVNTNSTDNSSSITNNNSGTDDDNKPTSKAPEVNTNDTNPDKTVTNNYKKPTSSSNTGNEANSGNKTDIATSNNNTTPTTNNQPNKSKQPQLNKPNNNGLANNGDMIANNNQTNSNVNNQFNSNTVNSNLANKNRQKLVLETLISIELDANSDKNKLAIYTENEEDSKIITKEKSNNKLSFVINVGALGSKNFNENSINLDFPYLGGELYYQINNKFNASIGVAWYKRSGIGYINSFTSTEYGFGKKESTTVITFDKIYFAEIPLKLNYSLTRNHLIGVGGTYSFILGGENRILSNQTENTSSGTSFSGNEDGETIPGFENAYAKNSKAIFVSYEYRKNRFGAEIRYHYGLNDITNDNIFNKTQVDKNSRLLFTLKYLLFK